MNEIGVHITVSETMTVHPNNAVAQEEDFNSMSMAALVFRIG